MLLSNFENTFHTVAQAPGGVARLRELILTLAVQGKLVAQDASDEPASELLKKIRAEKDRLIAEGKIKKDKPLAEITEEEKPFELPVGWEWVRLGDIAQTRTGFAFKSSQYRDVGTLVFRVTNIRSDGGVDLSDVKYIDDISANEIYKNFFLAEGDIILVMVGGSLGKIGLISKECLPAVLNQNMWKIVGSSYINKKYLVHILRYINSNQLNVTNSTHGHLAQGDYLLKPVAIPPLAEQSRIVTRVEELMRLCDALEEKGRLEHTQHQQLLQAMLDSLTQTTNAHELACHWQRLAQHFDLLIDRPEAVDALEQTILQLAVRGLLVPQDPSDEPASELLKKIREEKDRLIAERKIKKDKPLPAVKEEEVEFSCPIGWKWVRFGDISNIASNLVKPDQHKDKWQVAPDCIEKGTGLLIEKRTVKDAEIISPNHLFKPGQLLYSKIRPSLSKAVLVDFEGLCSADMYPVDSFINKKYLLMYILSQPFLNQVKVAENRVKMPKLNQEAVVSFTVALPPLAEQSRIVARVTELRTLCQQLREKLTQARTTQTQLAQAWVEQVAA